MGELFLQTELEHFMAMFKLFACLHMTHEPHYLRAVYCLPWFNFILEDKCFGSSEVNIHQWTWGSLVCKAVILALFLRDKKSVCGHLFT